MALNTGQYCATLKNACIAIYKMNILFTTSAAPRSSPFSTEEKRPPLGIGSLIALLRTEGHKVLFIDTYLKPVPFIEQGYLQKNHVDCLGVYANTICWQDTLRMLQAVEKLRKRGSWRGKILVGGPHTSAAPETIPAFVDHIVQGEGETAVLEIARGRVNERIVKKERSTNLDALPFQPWDIFAQMPYDFSCQWLSVKPIFTMNTSRGCPFNCTFCSVGSIWGKLYTYYSAERIISEIDYLVKTFGAKGIYFREDNFTLKKERVISFCELLLRKNMSIQWMCETRIDTLDENLLTLMRRAGCEALYIGVESGSQRVLDFLKKGIRVEQVENIFRLCHTIGIKTCASFIVGIPTETEAERAETIALSKRLQPTTSWINVFVGIPRSPLYEYVLKNHLYEDIDTCGLVYLKGHNQLVDQFYRGDPKRKIPRHPADQIKTALKNFLLSICRKQPKRTH